MSLHPAEDRALAAIGDGLQKSAPDLARALDAFARPRRFRRWALLLAAVVCGGGVVAVFGLRGMVILSCAAVLASPLVVALVFCSQDGPFGNPSPPAD